MSANGGEDARVFQGPADWLTLAKQEQIAAFWEWDPKLQPSQAVRVVDLQRGERRNRFPVEEGPIRLTADARSILYVQERDGQVNVWQRLWFSQMPISLIM